MCYSIPGKVVSAENGFALVDYFGETRRAVLEGVSVSEGDFVYVQAGFVVKKVGGKVGEATVASWKNLLDNLKRRDAEFSARPAEPNPALKEVIEKSWNENPLSLNEVTQVLETSEENDLAALYSAANELRRKKLSNSCCVHGIIEFSNHCGCGCAYCGIRAGNAGVERYRLTPEQIIEAAEFACNRLGFKALVLQSGEDAWYDEEKLCEIVRRIKEKCGAVLFLSIGERSASCYRRLFDAGARGALVRFETSDARLYEKLRGKKLSERLALIKELKRSGYLIATGALVGLPGQSKESISRDVLLTNSLGAEMYSFGPFIPHPNTPLGGGARTKTDEVLKVLAAARLADPGAKILVTTALETLDAEGRRKGLLAGGNSIMLNATPDEFKRLYEIYPNKAGAKTPLKEQISEAVSLLHSLGRAPTDLGYGG